MKNHVVLYFLVLFTFCSCAQGNKNLDIIGTWEMLEMKTNNSNQIDVGELVLNNSQIPSSDDSIKRIIEETKAKDLRFTKWYYFFDKEYFYEYRLGVGWKFKSKIKEGNIYKFEKPYYKILSLKNDTLKIKEYSDGKTLTLKKVNTSLEGLKIVVQK